MDPETRTQLGLALLAALVVAGLDYVGVIEALLPVFLEGCYLFVLALFSLFETALLLVPPWKTPLWCYAMTNDTLCI